MINNNNYYYNEKTTDPAACSRLYSYDLAWAGVFARGARSSA